MAATETYLQQAVSLSRLPERALNENAVHRQLQPAGHCAITLRSHVWYWDVILSLRIHAQQRQPESIQNSVPSGMSRNSLSGVSGSRSKN